MTSLETPVFVKLQNDSKNGSLAALSIAILSLVLIIIMFILAFAVGTNAPQGAKGDIGPAGDPGQQGPKGDKGPIGSQGTNGATNPPWQEWGSGYVNIGGSGYFTGAPLPTPIYFKCGNFNTTPSVYGSTSISQSNQYENYTNVQDDAIPIPYDSNGCLVYTSRADGGPGSGWGATGNNLNGPAFYWLGFVSQ